ncbi:hypothetical protein Q0590_34605 [Rhodocytophaga aerolata]|uniref:Uncharacterized protein n=1 Tax=Rhodocytophaga aerolata TaxID=455078 RepID=A0ABT8RH70_9BACT|nr:hypothetical protein [Rhodocytophaga aerolata]MDO1451457.1 hypothetical protein [Rhodocytophaga aerolata]
MSREAELTPTQNSITYHLEARVDIARHTKLKTDHRMKQHEKIELVAVFKKDIQLSQAQELLDKTGISYRKGMDSSKGKLYFYSTGPKFILTFESQADKETFIAQHAKKEAFHELYTPDWTKQKD